VNQKHTHQRASFICWSNSVVGQLGSTCDNGTKL